MPKTYVRKSAVKSHRKDEAARVKNKAKRNELATGEKKLRTAVESKDVAVQEIFSQQCSVLDKAVKNGVIHKNKANRKKSRLASIVNEAKA